MAVKQVFSGLWWVVGKFWWLLDASRRALLNLLLLLLVVLLLVGLFSRGPAPLKDKTTLVLNLQGPLVEQFSGSARDQAMAQLQGKHQQQTRLRDVLATLEAAALDPQIGSVLLQLDEFSGAGLAGLGEVAAALDRFKAKGKPVLAYGDGYNQRGYYLAARANEVYLHPLGMVMIEGFGRYRTYYKDALDRLGVSANVLRVGAFKNAAEPYFANGPSKEALEAEAYLYGDLWERYTGAVETARKLPKGSLSKGIDTLPETLTALKGDTAQLALQAKLVDGLKTRDEMRELLMERGAKDDKGKSFRQVSMSDYQAYIKPKSPQGDSVGVVVAEGEIVDGDASAGRIGGDSTARLIRPGARGRQGQGRGLARQFAGRQCLRVRDHPPRAGADAEGRQAGGHLHGRCGGLGGLLGVHVLGPGHCRPGHHHRLHRRLRHAAHRRQAARKAVPPHRRLHHELDGRRLRSAPTAGPAHGRDGAARHQPHLRRVHGQDGGRAQEERGRD